MPNLQHVTITVTDLVTGEVQTLDFPRTQKVQFTSQAPEPYLDRSNRVIRSPDGPLIVGVRLEALRQESGQVYTVTLPNGTEINGGAVDYTEAQDLG